MNTWLKIRVWTKVILFVIVALYVLIFVLKNTGEGKQVSLWVWFDHTPTMPVLFFIPAAFFLGVITTLLVRTITRTLGQIRQMKRKQAEKEAAAIIARAAKLRVRAETGTPVV
jgi:H+/Cl- antiporter ClcA